MSTQLENLSKKELIDFLWKQTRNLIDDRATQIQMFEALDQLENK